MSEPASTRRSRHLPVPPVPQAPVAATTDRPLEGSGDGASDGSLDAAGGVEAGVEVAQTRADRRAQRRPGSRGPRAPMPALPELSHVRRPYAVVATLAVALLMGLAGYGGMPMMAAAFLFAGLVTAWGWPLMAGMPSPRGSTSVLVFTAAALTVAAGADTEAPYLMMLPAGVAGGVLALFLHQLLRSDGRPRLTETVASGGTAIAVMTSGACYVALPMAFEGDAMVASALAAVAVSSLVDLLVRPLLQPWLLPLAMLAGAASAYAASVVTGHPGPQQALLLGLLVAGTGHALRRLAFALPATSGTRAQLAAGAASVLVTGVVTYVTPSLIAVVAYLWERVAG